jgi:hypothetical protein
MSTKKLYTDASIVIPNYPNLEATKTSYGRGMDKKVSGAVVSAKKK